MRREAVKTRAVAIAAGRWRLDRIGRKTKRLFRRLRIDFTASGVARFATNVAQKFFARR